MTGTFYTIHPTYSILRLIVLHLLWQSCTESNKGVAFLMTGDGETRWDPLITDPPPTSLTTCDM